MARYDHKTVDSKWQKKWFSEGVFWPKDIHHAKNMFYNLWMFPYPSAEGLHAGHAFASTGSDIYGRFMRMMGKDVFQPIGYDSFGIHSENFAISIGETPQKMLERTTKHYESQLKSLGHGYDWTKTVTTSDIDYYRWTQWLFVQLFKAGLAYRKKSLVNWCPSCKTVLADEQVINGKCERCKSEVYAKELKQWFFRITGYSERLLANLDKIVWSDRVVTAQKNWIGKKEGINITYDIKDHNEKVTVFTTAPVNFGATFLVVAPEYAQEKLLKIIPGDHLEEVKEYIKVSLNKSEQQRMEDVKDKSGVFTGLYAINHVTSKEIPIWITDFVLMDVGTGAVQGCPGHDVRDFRFAKKFGIPIPRVVVGEDGYDGPIEREDQVVEHGQKGKFVNSDFLNELEFEEGLQRTMDYIEKNGWGKRVTTYHLRDWLVSRQRYWGPPIPMIYCESCAKEGSDWFTFKGETFKGTHEDQSDWESAGWYPEESLPVELPELENYQPTGTGKGPLANHPEFYKTKCPNCGKEATRETDVSDTFVDSSWYFLRYPSTRQARSGQVPFDPKITEKWLPVDLYFGGAEHSVLHLMYARFIWMVLFDLGYFNFSPKRKPGPKDHQPMTEDSGWEEPFPRFFAHGLMIKDGAKMSKSRGNVVNPDEYIEKFGADTLRLYLMFMGPMDGYPDFRDTGIEGMRKFVERVWDLYANYKDLVIVDEKSSKDVMVKMHQTIKKVTEDIENFRYNTAISAIMEFVNLLREKPSQPLATSSQSSDNSNQPLDTGKTDSRMPKAEGRVRCAEWDEALEILTKLLAPFAPHMAEEVWVNMLGQKFSVHNSAWPKYNPELVKDTDVTIPVQVNGKLRGQITVKRELSEAKDKIIELAKKEEKVKKWITGKNIKNEIFIPGKLLNFVVN